MLREGEKERESKARTAREPNGTDKIIRENRLNIKNNGRV